MNLKEIETQTRDLSVARDLLSETVLAMNTAIEAIKNEYLASIKRRVARVADMQATLSAGIQSSPELFVEPRTYVFHGIKVGLHKGACSISWDDDETMAEAIREHFPKQFKVLVKTTHKPQKKALLKLSAEELQKLPCSGAEGGDVVVIKPTDSEVDKIVSALLKGATDEAVEKAAA